MAASGGQRRDRPRARLGARIAGERLVISRGLRRFLRRGRVSSPGSVHDQGRRVVDRARPRHRRVLAVAHRRIGRRARRGARRGRGARPDLAGVKLWRQASPFGEVTVVVSEAGLREISHLGDIGRRRAARQIARSRASSTTGSRASAKCSTSSSISKGSRAFGGSPLERSRLEVPWGEIVTYGELAGMAGRPRAARAVGSAMRDNPLPFVIPCHRVPPRRSRRATGSPSRRLKAAVATANSLSSKPA